MDWRLEDRMALLAGQASARDVCHHLPWLRRPLVATESARERLTAWALAGGLSRPKPDTTALQFYGDKGARVSAIMALDLMAPPARDYILDNVMVFGVGVTSVGWCGTVAGALPRRIVALSQGANEDNNDGAYYARRIALHEFAHAWLEPEELASSNLPTVRRDELPPGKFYTKQQTPVELRAWSLTECWEGEPLGADFWFKVRQAMS
jgi:hypothetical protein